MKVYICVIEDRHTDVDVVVFSEPEKAIEYAGKIAKERRYCTEAEMVESVGEDWNVLNEHMIEAGWLFYSAYSEGDCVSVQPKEVVV